MPEKKTQRLLSPREKSELNGNDSPERLDDLYKQVAKAADNGDYERARSLMGLVFWHRMSELDVAEQVKALHEIKRLEAVTGDKAGSAMFKKWAKDRAKAVGG